MPNTTEQSKSLNVFAGQFKDDKVTIDSLTNPQPIIEMLYYKYDAKTAEAMFGKSRFSQNVAVCQATVHNALNIFDTKQRVYSDISIQYDIIVYKNDGYETNGSVYISLYSKVGMAQFSAGIMTLPEAPIVVKTVSSTEAEAHNTIVSTIEEHIKTLRLRLSESIKV